MGGSCSSSRRAFLASSWTVWSRRAAEQILRLAPFRSEVTPARGEPLIWVTPLVETLDPLWAKGVVLEHAGRRLVVCALDWCGLGGAAYLRLRDALARAAGGAVVILHTVHQHAAPYVDGDAYALLRGTADPPLMYSDQGLGVLAKELADAVRTALGRLEPADAVGLARVRVERVASTRRVWDQGKLVVRYSNGGRDPYQAQLPEGDIDPWLRTVTFARQGRALVRLHFYATHPQTFCCDGRASADFVGQARESLEREEGVPQIYLTGCAGDVTVGKYNDGSGRARRQLGQRLLEAMRAAAAAVRYEPLGAVAWRTVPLRLPARAPEATAARSADPAARYRAACRAAYARRRRPLEITAAGIGPARILHLPGEPMLAFQRFAQQLGQGRFVAVAGYGDIAPGYLCTDRAFEEGGYEPSASHVAPGSEPLLRRAIERALAE